MCAACRDLLRDLRASHGDCLCNPVTVWEEVFGVIIFWMEVRHPLAVLVEKDLNVDCPGPGLGFCGPLGFTLILSYPTGHGIPCPDVLHRFCLY